MTTTVATSVTTGMTTRPPTRTMATPRTRQQPTLEASDITKEFQEGRDVAQVLKGVSLSLVPGEIVSLEGPSGSGKTTLLSVLGCILAPTSGRVTVAGEFVDPARPREWAAIRRRFIGFAFQQYNLFPALTVVENVEYALNVKGVRRGARAIAESVVDAVGLTDRRDALPRDLSGGQKQRVAIARAIAATPPVLLADEPTANLDSHIGGQILDTFRTLAKRNNQSLLIVTHDPSVRRIVDRVITIRDGRFVP